MPVARLSGSIAEPNRSIGRSPDSPNQPPCAEPEIPSLSRRYPSAQERPQRRALRPETESAVTAIRSARAFSVPMELERRLYLLVLTRFLYANRYPLRWKTLPNDAAKRFPPRAHNTFRTRRAAGDERPQVRQAVRAHQPASQGCARYCAVGALDILQGCTARRSWP
jgi:hypothetical protein